MNGQNFHGDGTQTISVNAGDTVTIAVNSGRTFARTLTVKANPNQQHITVPVVAVDMNQDGIINAKDYAAVLKLSSADQKTKYASVIEAFLNTREADVTY